MVIPEASFFAQVLCTMEERTTVQDPSFDVHFEKIERKYVGEPNSSEIERRASVEGVVYCCLNLILQWEQSRS